MDPCCGRARAVLIWAVDRYYFHPFGHCIKMTPTIRGNKNHVFSNNLGPQTVINRSSLDKSWHHDQTLIISHSSVLTWSNISDSTRHQAKHQFVLIVVLACAQFVARILPLSFYALTPSLWVWQLHLCGAVSCQLEKPQTCTAQPRSDTQYAAKNGQQEADRRPPGSRSTQLSTMEEQRREAALNWANVTLHPERGNGGASQKKLWLKTFDISLMFSRGSLSGLHSWHCSQPHNLTKQEVEECAL